MLSFFPLAGWVAHGKWMGQSRMREKRYGDSRFGYRNNSISLYNNYVCLNRSHAFANQDSVKLFDVLVRKSYLNWF